MIFATTGYSKPPTNNSSLLVIFCLCFGFSLRAQEKSSNFLQKAIAETAVSARPVASSAPHRKMLSLKDARWTTRLNPFTYLAVGLMYTYQNIISEQISAECTYEISCSEMTKKSIEAQGLFKGTLIGLHQLTNCFPAARYDHCDHLISGNNKIINVVE